MRIFQVFCDVITLSLMLALSFGNLAQAKVQDRDIDQLKDQIHKETKLNTQEIDALEPELRAHLQLKGRGETVRAMVKNSLNNGCQGTCLSETLRTMNQSMSKGLSGKEALEMVTAQLREQIRERDQKQLKWSDQELGDKVRTRMDARLLEREQLHERSMEHGTMKGVQHQKMQSGRGVKR
ncbi:MAG: hypothetical protein A2X86_12690 [Bdellovibrionales bacterium GWA2_49_15]|nr:MAG: hypothetical protein A2X86_12690 [Bdellovibrionales bacterium GWA2_49_15]HAZ14710.1 hypothetical protein [Bdellovibrionales bacterium]